MFSSSPFLKMFSKSVMLILSKPRKKPAENEPENARLAAKKPCPCKKKIKKLLFKARASVSKQLGTDSWYGETESSNEKEPLQSPEVSNTRNCKAEDNLSSDRSKLQRLQILNSTLINELADAKLSAERYLQYYENEREKLADAEEELDTLQRETQYIQEKMQKEIDRIKVAANWQRGAFQMKLDDAKLIFERKYDELGDLRAQLEAFVRKNCGNDAIEAVKEAEVLLEAVGTAKVQVLEGVIIPTTHPLLMPTTPPLC